MLHVLVSENRYFEDIRSDARARAPIDWIVPKIASVGDYAVMFVPEHGFVARGTIQEHPISTTLIADAVPQSKWAID